MRKHSITIAMSIRNKNDCLGNTLFSIKNQDTKYKYNLCFFDDGSKVSPEPIIKKYFKPNLYRLKVKKNSVSFENFYRELNKFIPSETSILILQSADIIWRDRKCLDKLVEPFFGKNGSINDIITIPMKIKNYDINPYLHEGTKFYDGLNKDLNNLLGRGHDQNPKYMFLGAMKRDTFSSILNCKAWNSDAVCDIIMRDTITKNLRVPIRTIDTSVVHQRHIKIDHKCSSIDICSHPCAPRRSAILNGVKYPRVKGFYDWNAKKWKKYNNNKVKYK